MSVIKIVGAVVATIVVLLVIGFGLRSIGMYSQGYFGAWQESNRRDIQIESRAYSEGTVQLLYKMQREYHRAKNDAERRTIAASARQQLSMFPKERLPADLQAFVNQIN